LWKSNVEDYQDVGETLEKSAAEANKQTSVKMAAAVVCLKNSAAGLQTLQQEVAAIRIQTAFRGFLVSSSLASIFLQ
jgi:hypothetical protein